MKNSGVGESMWPSWPLEQVAIPLVHLSRFYACFEHTGKVHPEGSSGRPWNYMVEVLGSECLPGAPGGTLEAEGTPASIYYSLGEILIIRDWGLSHFLLHRSRISHPLSGLTLCLKSTFQCSTSAYTVNSFSTYQITPIFETLYLILIHQAQYSYCSLVLGKAYWTSFSSVPSITPAWTIDNSNYNTIITLVLYLLSTIYWILILCQV